MNAQSSDAAETEKMLKLREQLLAVEEDRLHGAVDHTLEEVDAYLERMIAET